MSTLLGRSKEAWQVTGASATGSGLQALGDGARIAVVGGGPAGAFFSYFALRMAERDARGLSIDIFEPKNFHNLGPGGCNMCGGIVSESMVQLLATEGINLPPGVVQRGIDSYVLHADTGSVRIRPPGQEKRIASVHRGGGPRGSKQRNWAGFDGHLLELAIGQGARLIGERVEGLEWEAGKRVALSKSGRHGPYDLVVLATGVNNAANKLIEKLGLAAGSPKTTKTFICELELKPEIIDVCLGTSMHVFLLNIPRLEFAALIPKGDYVTLVLLGENVDKALVEAFLSDPRVRAVLPPGWQLSDDYCRCFPSINVFGAAKPYADRLVLIGDAGESRLYKDGIGGAYRTAKAAARAALFHGVSEKDFAEHYAPVCKALHDDNRLGRLVFMATGVMKRVRLARRGMVGLTASEQGDPKSAKRLSGILWDTFTGSAPYRDVFFRIVHPALAFAFGAAVAKSLFGWRAGAQGDQMNVNTNELGRVYHDGESIVREGDAGECMYIIQSGRVQVVKEGETGTVVLKELADGDFFGEMAVFDREMRSATVRAVGDVRVLTVDKKMLLRKAHEDPSLVFRIMVTMSKRIRDLNEQLAGQAEGR